MNQPATDEDMPPAEVKRILMGGGREDGGLADLLDDIARPEPTPIRRAGLRLVKSKRARINEYPPDHYRPPKPGERCLYCGHKGGCICKDCVC